MNIERIAEKLIADYPKTPPTEKDRKEWREEAEKRRRHEGVKERKMGADEMVANELVLAAKELMATDFPSQEALDKYLKEHPDADKSQHHVVKDDLQEHVTKYKKTIEPEARAEIRKHVDREIKKRGLDPKKTWGVHGVSKAAGEGMDNEMVAQALVMVAKELMAIDFPTKGALDKYLKDHPDADKGKHKVVEKAPAKKWNPSVNDEKLTPAEMENWKKRMKRTDPERFYN